MKIYILEKERKHTLEQAKNETLLAGPNYISNGANSESFKAVIKEAEISKVVASNDNVSHCDELANGNAKQAGR
jgi:hypothetical protein